MARAGVRALLCLVAGLVVPVLAAGPALACSCADLSLEEQVEAAEVVAQVVVNRTDQPPMAGGYVTYYVSTTRVWKGDIPLRFSFLSPQQGPSCGLDGVPAGRELLLLARPGDTGPPTEDRGALVTYSCDGTGTATADRIADVTALLGEGAVPIDPGDPPPAEPGAWGLPVGVAVVAVAGVLAFLLWRRRTASKP